MELICRLIKQEPRRESEYEKDGQKQKFVSIGFHLQQGDDSFYAEMIQEAALKQGELTPNYYYRASLKMSERSFTDKNNETRTETRIILSKICLL